MSQKYIRCVYEVNTSNFQENMKKSASSKLAGQWPDKLEIWTLVLKFGNDDIDPTKVSREAKW